MDAATPMPPKKRVRRDPPPTTPDPIEIAMEAEAAGRGPEGVARQVLTEQLQLIRTQTALGRWQTASERVSVFLKGLMGAAGLAAAIVLAMIAWTASRDHSVVFEAIGAPEDMIRQGESGEALARALQDKLAQLQAETRSQFITAQFRGNDTGQLKVEIPATGISIGELNHALREWLGHQTHVSAEVSRLTTGPDAGALVLSTRVSGRPGVRLVQKDGDLDALMRAGAEGIYGAVDPMRYAQWLDQHDRTPEALATLRQLEARSAGVDRAEALYVLTGMESPTLDLHEGRDRYAEIVRLSKGQVGLNNLAGFEFSLGHAEASYQAYVLAERRQNGRGVALTDETRTSDKLSARSNVASQVGDFQATLESDCFTFAVAPCTGVELARKVSQPGYLTMLGAGMPTASGRALTSQHDIASAARLLATPRPQARSPWQQSRAEFNWLQAMVALHWKREDWPAMLAAADAADAIGVKYPGLKSFGTGTVYRPLALAGLGDAAGAEQAAAAMPADCYRCLFVRAMIAAGRRDWSAADRWFSEATRLAPSLPSAESEWGYALLAQGKPDEAIRRLKSAHVKGPRFADPLEYWGEALLAKGDARGAAAKFTEAAKYAPRWGRLHLKWGEALAKLGKADKAKARWQTAAKLDLTPDERAELARVQGAK